MYVRVDDHMLTHPIPDPWDEPVDAGLTMRFAMKLVMETFYITQARRDDVVLICHCVEQFVWNARERYRRGDYTTYTVDVAITTLVAVN